MEGTIGDSDPLQAAVDASRLFPADELVFVTHREDEEHWVERDLVSRARDRFPDLPIVHLLAGPRRLLELVA